MQLKNSFRVPVPVEEVWAALMDVERVAPCMPGASLDSVEGDTADGTVKVRLGPIAMSYRGSVTFVERDEATRRTVMAAQAKESRGSGTASATVAASLSPDRDGTVVDVHTDLMVTGKPAQFGRGVMEDVSGRLMDQFADNLSTLLTSGPAPAPAGAGRAAAAPAAGASTAAPSSDLDAWSVLWPVLRARLPLVLGGLGGAAVLAVAVRAARRR